MSRSPLARACRPGALLAALLLGACGKEAPPSVVLVTLDTTRWDRIGAYGDPITRTPELDALARGGTLCRTALVDASTTLPSHASMMTGAVVLRHGMRLNGAYRLPAEARTLADVLSEQGYGTAAVLSSAALAATYGLDQGFDVYDDAMPDSYQHHDPALWIRARRVAGNQRRAAQTTAAALRVLADLKPPAFLWVHYVDAHQPDDPIPPWSRIPGLDPYRADVATVDREMGRMLRRTFQALGGAIVAVIADHGENLGEHREHGHNLFLSEAILRVPLVLHGPGVPAAILSGTVTNADLAPTLLAAAGLPGERFPDGVDILKDSPSLRSVLAETRVPTQHFGGAPVKAMRGTEWKYVLSPRPEVYDLLRDPGETRNVFGADPARDSRLRQELAALVEDALAAPLEPAAVPADLDESDREALRALGYVASADVRAPDELASEGLDPKDLVDVVGAVDAVTDGLMDAARAPLERFWREHREPPDSSWHALFSRAHFCQAAVDFTDGDVESALRHARRSLDLDPGFEDPRLLLARLR